MVTGRRQSRHVTNSPDPLQLSAAHHWIRPDYVRDQRQKSGVPRWFAFWWTDDATADFPAGYISSSALSSKCRAWYT